MNTLGHPEVQELLGAYALDALDPGEADAVDLHLRECPRCRAEVEEYRETAAMLAFGGVAAPPGVTAAAAVVISLVALSVSVARSGGEDGSSLADRIGAVVQEPEAIPVHLASDGRGSADVYLYDGKAFLVKHSLPALGEGETYQLWGQKGETKVSLAVLGASPQQAELPLGGEYDALAITAEKSPGVVASNNPAVVAGLVPTD
jgi:hypothetical protein